VRPDRQRKKYTVNREWLLQQIADSQIPAILLSGDRHLHEISVLDEWQGDYPLIDITSSGLTHSWENFPGEENSLRHGEVFTGLGGGVLMIDWAGSILQTTVIIKDVSN
jgi:alkaline phosphatase D